MGDYRYLLTRSANSLGAPMLFVMLNPSTATETEDDPTIRRCIRFAQTLELDWPRPLEVVNLFAYRATDPADLVAAHSAGVDIVGPDNDEAIESAVARAGVVVAGWGASVEKLPAGLVGERVRKVSELCAEHRDNPYCLGTTKAGHPRHPLYVKGGTPLVVWDGQDG